MPSWKKIILSGSDAALNTLNVTNSITASVISASQFTGSLFGTSSWANNAISASHALTASSVNTLRQNVLITGSLGVSGSITIGQSGSSNGTLTIWKNSSGEAIISFPNSFPPQNDIGWIKHIESTADVGRMEFRVGDNSLIDPDEFWFGSSPDPDIITLRTNGDIIQRTGSLFIQSGSLFLTGSARITGSIILTGSLTASGDISIRDFPSVSASLASLSSGVGTLQQVTNAGNTTTNAISSSFPGVGFFGTASWAINVVNGGGGGGGGSDSAFLNQSTADVTWSFTHNLGTQYPVITVYDTSGQVIIPQEIDGEDTNNLKIYFPTSQSGYATAVGGTSALTYYSQSLTTASVNLNTITFTKGDSSTFPITVNTGSTPTLQQVTTQGASTTIPITASIISASSFTGSLFGTASWAFNAITASHALTASSADNFIVRNSLTASGLNYPSADNGEFSFIQTDGNGNLSLQYVNTLYEIVYNGEATQLAKGTPVYISGANGANSIAYRADAGNPSKMPVVYVTADAIDPADTGRAIALGLITGVDTTGYLEGTEIYVGVGGGWTSTRPTGSAIVQVLGYVTKEGVGGQGVVLNPGPANLPNLPSGSVWLGNSGSVPTAVSSASLFVNSASYAMTSSTVTVIDNESTAGAYAIIFADPAVGSGVQLQSDASTFLYVPNLGQVLIGSESSYTLIGSGTLSTAGAATSPYTLLDQAQQTVNFGNTGGAGAFSTLNIRHNIVNIVGSVTASIISASSGITGSLFGTASWAVNSLTSSFTPNAITTASVSLNTITFTKGSGATFNITVDTGSGGGGGGSVTINNNVDNYLITATGTANTLNGEANLQYSSSILINRGRSLFTYSGLGVANTTHYFRTTGSDTNAGFLVADKDGEDLFKVAGSIADSDSLITIGDVGNAANATKIEVNDATNYINLQGVTRANQIATEATALSAAGEFDIGSRIARDWSSTGPALIAGRIVYLSGSTQWAQAQANASGSSYGMLGVVINTESQREILIEGTIRISGSALSSGIVGQPVYLSAATAGQVSLTAPTGSGQISRVIGYVYRTGGNVMYFRPDNTYTVGI